MVVNAPSAHSYHYRFSSVSDLPIVSTVEPSLATTGSDFSLKTVKRFSIQKVASVFSMSARRIYADERKRLLCRL